MAQPSRSRLPKHEARREYVRLGEEAVIDQVRDDAEAVDKADNEPVVPAGPFTRLDAGAVAQRFGKTRGAITNLFGSQVAFQAATMFPADDDLDVGGFDKVVYPAPGDFSDAESWILQIA